MTRCFLSTRAASPADLPQLLELWTELREVGGRTARTVDPTRSAVVADRLARALADPDLRVVVAEEAGETVGMAVLGRIPLSPLSEETVVQLTTVVVRGGHRRRGVGRALVGAAASYADELGSEHVVVSVYPALREANRFYARLGFAPMVVRRIATVGALRRRLAAAERRPPVADVVRLRSRRRIATAVVERSASTHGAG